MHLKIPFSAVETENPRPSSILLVFSLPNSKPNICSISEERTLISLFSILPGNRSRNSPSNEPPAYSSINASILQNAKIAISGSAPLSYLFEASVLNDKDLEDFLIVIGSKYALSMKTV